jgi:hypothetical protein
LPAARPAHPLKLAGNPSHAGKSKTHAARRNGREPQWGFSGINACTLVPAPRAHPDWIESACALDFRFAQVLVGKPVSTLDQVRGRLFPGHALRQPLLATAMLNRDRSNKQVY